MKAALFDFCNTVVNFQTADEFVYYVIEHIDIVRIKKREKVLNKISRDKLLKKIDSYTKGKFSLKKRFVLWQLRGLSQEVLKSYASDYYKKIVVPNIYIDTLNFIFEYQKKGYLVYLVSGGYDIYLEYFVEEYGLNGCFCTKLKFRNGIFTGLMDGRDCMGVQKVETLNTFLNTNVECTVAYSDSKSDLPLLHWADKGIVVSKSNYRKWAIEQGLEEYILSGKTVGNL